MVECEICGTHVSGGSAFTCTYCGGTYCPAHRLPFNHGCTKIEDWRNAKPQKKLKTSSKPKTILADQRSLIAGGAIMLFLIIFFLWFFRMI